MRALVSVGRLSILLALGACTWIPAGETGDGSKTPIPEPVDTDGDGLPSEEDCDDPDAQQQLWRDEDLDGFGEPGQEIDGCPTPGWVPAGEPDCDDLDALTYPGADEVVGDGIDQDCDGQEHCFADADDDGARHATLTIDSADADCTDAGEALSTDVVDCDDNDAFFSPLADETPGDSIDQDCDGQELCYTDADGDGSRSAAIVSSLDADCDDPFEGSVPDPIDCDDADPSAHPGAQELPGDNIDQDCDGTLEPIIEVLAPGRAGRTNRLVVSRALPGAQLQVSSSVGTQVAVAGCPALTIDAGSPVAEADQDGNALLEVFVAETLLEQSATYRVVQAANCNVSAPLAVTFPARAALDLANADAELTGEGSGQAGWSVSGVGDVDGDGDGDLLVGDYLAGGGAYVVLGPVSGTIGLASADAKLTGETTGDQAGFSVAGAGDVNADGYDDLLVGAPRNDAGGADAGRAYLVLGPVSGTIGLASADAILTGELSGDLVGQSVAGAGDVNADGYDDLIVGAYPNDLGGTDAGRAYLVLGPVSGTIGLASADAILTGLPGDRAGSCVSGAGDVNADGYDDLLIGALDSDAGSLDSGAAYLVYGPATGALHLANADAILAGETSGGDAGESVSGAGDIDGDGYDDLLIGARYTDTGRAYLVHGPVSGTLGLANADARLTGEASGDQAGESVSGAGDVNADGYDDLLVGAPRNDAGGADAGRAYLVLGPVSGTVGLASADAVFTGETAGAQAGFSVSGAGDVGGDALDDVIVGSPFVGSTYLIFGNSL